MVKFGVNYESHISNKYGNKSYVDYDSMKLNIYNSTTSTQFLDIFYAEILRIDTIFRAQMSALHAELNSVEQSIQDFLHVKIEKQFHKIKESALKRKLTGIYSDANDLDTYRILNFTACIKILKKHDKIHKKEPLFDTTMTSIENLELGSGINLKEILHKVEDAYARSFCDGVLAEAIGKLRVTKGENDSRLFVMASFKMGGIITLCLWYINNILLSSSAAVDFFLMRDPSIFLYTVIGSLIVYKWLWAFNVWLWEGIQLDYIHLLQLNPKHMPSSGNLFSKTSTLTILYLLNLLVYHTLKNAKENGAPIYMPLYVPPLLLLVGALMFMLHSVVKVSTGLFNLKMAHNLLTSPFYHTGLRETFCGDILTSFSRIMGTTVSGVCFVITGAILDVGEKNEESNFAICTTSSEWRVASLLCVVTPVVIRFLQCVRKIYEVIAHENEENLKSLVLANQWERKSARRQLQSEVDMCARTKSGGDHSNSFLFRSSSYTSLHNLKCQVNKSLVKVAAASDTNDCLSEKDCIQSGSYPIDTFEGANTKINDAGYNSDAEICASNRLPRESISNSPADMCHTPPPEQSQSMVHSVIRTISPMKPRRDVYQAEEENNAAFGCDKGCVSEEYNRLDEKSDKFYLQETSISNHRHHTCQPGVAFNGTSIRSESWALGDDVALNGEKESLAEHEFNCDNDLSENGDDEVDVKKAHACKTNIVFRYLTVYPHSYNALKYTLSMLVISLGAYPLYTEDEPGYRGFFIAYVVLAVLSTLYSTWWDYIMDWGLMRSDSKYALLRPVLLYASNRSVGVWYYYFALIINPLLRGMWTLSFTSWGKMPLFAFFELGRRFIWTTLRLEYFQLQHQQDIKKR